MGENATETVEEIEVLRDRLDGEIRALEERVPAPARWTKQLVGVAVGGGVGGGVVLFAIRKVRGKRRESKAAASASDSMGTVIRLLPDDVADDLARQITRVIDSGAWRPWAGGIAAVWVLTRMAELRALRRLAAAHA